MSRLTRKRKRRDRAARRSTVFLGVGGAIVGLMATAVLACFCLASTWLSDLPDYTNIDLYAKSGYSTIYASDRTTVLGRITLENRIEVAMNEVSPYVLEGTVATEDERFYTHRGVDLMGIGRAIVVNLTRGGTSEGASTITQQLVRNTILLSEMSDITAERKVREMYLACKVEEVYNKDQILMMYLNVINYGDGCYGIETAANDYFGVSASELTLSQAAMLVAIPQSPTANNPRTNYDNALERSHLVLSRMLKNGYITQAQYDEALADAPKLVKKKAADDDIANIAPYFVDYVKQLLQGDDFNISELAQGGLSIYTTLDVSCQEAANAAVKEGLADWDEELDASLTSIDPGNGHIVAMVGGRDYETSQFNLATQMSRQAGSSFKTFALVAALEAGVDPDNTYIDSSSPAQITETWTVNNSEGSGSGNMSLADATTYSVNTVYARLAHTLGADAIVKAAHDCGITSNLEAYESIALGAQGVNTLEMADAYATLASGGIHHDPVAVAEVVNSLGDTVYQHEDTEGERVMSAAVAKKVTQILRTVVEYGTGTGASLWCGQAAAGKTGTSEEGRDLWFCGYTPQYATAVWTGYPQERATSWYGGTISAPLWRLYMDTVLEDAEYEEFPDTEEQLEYTYDWDFPQSSWSSYSNSGSGDDDARYEDDEPDEGDEGGEDPGTPDEGEAPPADDRPGDAGDDGGDAADAGGDTGTDDGGDAGDDGGK